MRPRREIERLYRERLLRRFGPREPCEGEVPAARVRDEADLQALIRKAEAVLASATSRARKIVENAEEEARLIAQRAEERGHARGLARGLAEGAREHAADRAETRKVLEALLGLRAELVAEAREVALALGKDVALAALGADATRCPEVWAKAAATILEAAGSEEVGDRAAVLTCHPDLAPALAASEPARAGRLRVEVDPDAPRLRLRLLAAERVVELDVAAAVEAELAACAGGGDA